jgi:hypothetical protein
MKAKLLLALATTTLACLALADCGGGEADTSSLSSTGSSAPSYPLGSPASVLDTQEVLALAEKTSETALPFAVAGAAVTVYPVDDQTSEPMSIDGT